MASSRIERKLAAILYADVAGYSRLTGVDEEGTHRRLSSSLDLMAQTVETTGGRVVHYAGDAILADFPSVVDAVTCAVSVQRELRKRNSDLPKDRRVEFRIGINLGDVMVDRNDIYGDGVNIAARLETLAYAGGICISESVFNQLGDRIDVGYEFLGRQTVKNIATPVTAYRLLLDDTDRRSHHKRKFWQRFRTTKRVVLLSLAAVLAVALAAGGLMAPSGGPETVPAVEVSPFRVIGEETPPDAFDAGLTEDLITELAKRTDLKVVNQPPPGDDGGAPRPGGLARYRVEGTVRVAGGKVRITAQLIGVDSGFHLWGARYDREIGDTLAIQAEVAGRIVVNLDQQLVAAEAERVRTGTTMAGLVMLGLENLGRVGERAISGVLVLYDRIVGGSEDG